MVCSIACYSSPAVEFLEDNPREELGLTTALPIEDQMDTGTQSQSYRPLGAKTESHYYFYEYHYNGRSKAAMWKQAVTRKLH